jgi:replicative DNA helicase
MPLSTPIYQLKRRAKLLARDAGIPLHEAQDRIARREAFDSWSLLSARTPARRTRVPMLAKLADGDMLLLGARPGHGKTLAGLQLLIDAALAGRRTVFFTLEYTEQEALTLIRSIGGADHVPEIVTSDDIDANVIIHHLTGSPSGTVAVIDHLQILDQQRTKPALDAQVESLACFAQATGTVLTFLSQVDRAFDGANDKLPGMTDLRLPNAVLPTAFSKACFVHAGRMRWDAPARR